MKRCGLIGCALLFCSAIATAGSVTLSCTLPTLNEDGSQLTDLDGIRFYESLTAGGPYTLAADNKPAACSTVLDRPAGEYFFVATAYNIANEESQYSNEATKVVPDNSSPPNPPGNLTVQPGELFAYGLSQTADVIVAYPVARIPEGTACDSTMQFNDKNVVPRADVTEWLGSVRPEVIFARCGAG